jgi:predicted NACHT family NTPase
MPGATFDEKYVLDQRHSLLLGDPGAGKTTTMKRLCRHLLSDLQGDDKGAKSRIPIVLVLRSAELELGLCNAILRVLSFPDPVYTSAYLAEHRRLLSEAHDDVDERRVLEVKVKEIEKGMEDEPEYRRRILYQCLNAIEAVVLLDGLDEVPGPLQDKLRAEVSQLALNLYPAKVIVSCRSGSYLRSLEAFDTYEICPLDNAQARQLCSSIVENVEKFFSALSESGIIDQADRPLLLVQLAIIYRHSGRLPQRPVEVAERMIDLLLRSWDDDRGVHRVSGYSKFTPEAKRQFLAAISHDLTIKTRAKTFDRDQLKASYGRVHERFELPIDQADAVAEEIESHTGIMVKSGNAFEFSHLSLQEFLCGDHIVRNPSGEMTRAYLFEYPEPVAVAVALSSEPDVFFASLIIEQKRVIPWSSINSFINRLSVERPRFTSSTPLGVAFLKLMSHKDAVLDASGERFLALPNVGTSVGRALGRYKTSRPEDPGDEQSDHMTLRLPRGSLPTIEGVHMPESIRLKVDVVRSLDFFTKRDVT